MNEANTPPPSRLCPRDGDWPMRIPTASELGLSPDPCPLRRRGGREAGLARLASFLSLRGRDARRQTSSPIVAFDACMRGLDQHGWIKFRIRPMLRSFASYRLWLRWRWPEAHHLRYPLSIVHTAVATRSMRSGGTKATGRKRKRSPGSTESRKSGLSMTGRPRKPAKPRSAASARPLRKRAWQAASET